MGFMRKLFGADIPEGARDPSDDHWWTPVGNVSSSGVAVTHDKALAVSVVLACVKAIAECVGALPIGVYREGDNGDKERIRRHPLEEVLRRRPNDEQSAIEFREQMTAAVLLRGTAIAEILPGRRGAVDQLVPIAPETWTAEKVVDGQGRAQWRFKIQAPGESVRYLLRWEVFILRALMMDGSPCGLDPIMAEKQAIGASLAATDYAGRFFANDATPSGIIKHPRSFADEDAGNRFRRAWERILGGVGRGRVAVLEHGMEYQQVSVTPEQAQFLETRRYQDRDIARIFRVPPHKIGILDDATFSNVEHMNIDWVVDTITPWVVRWEQAVSRDLMTQADVFAEHNLAGLLRGDVKSRNEAYALGRHGGWLSVNEIRRLENQNAIPGGDRYLEPLNMVPAGSARDESGSEADEPAARRGPSSIRGATLEGGLWRITHKGRRAA